MKTLQIGRLKLKNQILLAPMLDITNLPYRLVCRKSGAGLAFTEMVNFPAMVHENPKTLKMMKTNKFDNPLGIQVTGNNLLDLKKIIPQLKKYDLVDLNCGCPSDRITDNKSGSYLLNDIELIASMIKLLKKEGLTVTAKIRLGFSKNNVIKIAKAIEKAGADALTVHARLANQGYDSRADWTWIAKVKKSVKIPVIGNGDVFTPEDAKKMLEICDGVMIARGAIGDPDIFARILEYLKNGKTREKDFRKNVNYFLEYLDLCERNDMIDMPQIKHLACHFVKGVAGAGRIRNEVMKCMDLNGIRDRISNILHEIH